ncbi:hypothetical protein M3Y95_00378200 [Aphelenchoides besseyi]|nr:hypothetical protein M3Y95_00378200 [Aphelenchoides besseyi]
MRSYDTLDARPNPYEKDPVLAAEQRLKKRRSKRFWVFGCSLLFAISVGIYLGYFFLLRSNPPASDSSDPPISNDLAVEPTIYETCEAYRLNGYNSGVYTLQLPKVDHFDVFCEMGTNESWTRMQLRVDESGEFWNRTIEEYRNGFGPLNGNHWLGLEKVRAFIDAGYRLRLRIRVDGSRCDKTKKNLTFIGDYDFWIGESSDDFRLNASRLWSNFSEPFVLINENGGKFSASNCGDKRLGFFNDSKYLIEERKHVILGAVTLFTYAFFTILYVLVLFAMLLSEHRHRASYKMMIQLGVIHVIGLQASGGATGILSIEGAIFCTHPTLIYVVGCIGLTTWCGSTFTNMLLGINRCCELYGNGLADRLFSGRRVYVWMLAPLIYMFCVCFYSQPPLYSSIQMTAFFNPFYGYFDDFGTIYHSSVHSSNNLFVCITELIIYTTLVILYMRATALASPEIRNSLRREKRLYIQIVMIGVVHFVASSCYVLMQFVSVNFFTTLTASTFYLLSQGLPGIIYLCVNRSIRRTLLAMVRLTVENSFEMINGKPSTWVDLVFDIRDEYQFDPPLEYKRKFRMIRGSTIREAFELLNIRFNLEEDEGLHIVDCNRGRRLEIDDELDDGRYAICFYEKVVKEIKQEEAREHNDEEEERLESEQIFACSTLFEILLILNLIASCVFIFVTILKS